MLNSNEIDISTLLTEKDKKLIKKSIGLLEKSGLYAKKELVGYIESGIIPKSVLEKLEKVLKIKTDLSGTVTIGKKDGFTDSEVIDLSATIYANQVRELDRTASDEVVAVDDKSRKIVKTAITKLNNYMIALETRKKGLEAKLPGANDDERRRLNDDITSTIRAMKVARQVIAKLSTMKGDHSIGLLSLVGNGRDVVGFLNSQDMTDLIGYLSRIEVTTNKDDKGKIISRTADVPDDPQKHPTYSAIEKLLGRFQKASKVPATKKKEEEPIIIEELPGGPKKRDIDGGGDPRIVVKKPGEEGGAPKKPDEEGGAPKKPDEEGETPVPGAVNQAKTKKLSVGRRIINWIGRHWFGLSAIALAVTLAVGAIFPAAAVAGTAFAAFNLNAPNFLFAVLGVGVVNHFAFGGLRHRNSAQEHLMRRERKVQRRIRKSEKLLEQVKKNEAEIARITSLREAETNPKKIKKHTDDILALHKKNSSLDSENMIIMQELQEEFMPVKMPPKWRIFSRMKHRFLTVTGNATLARNEAELEYAHRKKIEKLPETPEKAEKVEAMTMNGNLVDEFANFQFAKRKLQYSIEQRQQAVEELVPDEETRTHTAKSIISGLKKRHQKLHDMGKATQIVKGPVGAAAKPVGLAAKQIVESHKGEVEVTMDRVDGKLITTYDDGSITVETKNKQTRTYEPKK